MRQGCLVDVSVLGDAFVLYAHDVGDMVQLVLAQGRVVDDYGVVEVAALDEVGGQQLLYLAHEHEGTTGCNFVGEVAQVFEACVLVVQYG